MNEKRRIIKDMAKKRVKTKSTQTAASADQDVIGLVTTLVQKLVTLETKIDTVLRDRKSVV